MDEVKVIYDSSSSTAEQDLAAESQLLDRTIDGRIVAVYTTNAHGRTTQGVRMLGNNPKCILTFSHDPNFKVYYDPSDGDVKAEGSRSHHKAYSSGSTYAIRLVKQVNALMDLTKLARENKATPEAIASATDSLGPTIREIHGW